MTSEEVETAIRVLESIAASPEALVRLTVEQRRRLLIAAGLATHPSYDERRARARAFRRRDREQQRAHDEAVLTRAALRRKNALSAFLPATTQALLPVAPKAPPPPADPGERLHSPRACYVCKAEFDRVHSFYHSMCPPCADLNYEKREQTFPLDGRIALVTGARIKIGFETALKLLRAGAQVVGTTRFPVDAARRFAEQPDYESFCRRLQIYGLDLRHVGQVEAFSTHLASSLPRLDVLINNAAQTVRRPPAFYEHLRAGEQAPDQALPGRLRALLPDRRQIAPVAAPARWRDSDAAPLAALTWPGEAAVDPALFPAGQLDGDAQQIDLRTENSWRLTLADVPTPELVEVHLVNAIAPFVLTSRLKPLMMRHRTNDKHVVHVSAMEASFSRKKKTDKHPHTNMAKAALNMMTRTSAAEYAECGIYMNSVDTGWVTDEDPLHHAVRKERAHDFHPPLDAIDGAARVLDPLLSGLSTGKHRFGLFFKDYRPTDW